MKGHLPWFSLAILAPLALGQSLCPAPECDPSICQTPSCACIGSQPEEVALSDRPQIVHLSFDDGLTAATEDKFFRELFDGTFTNPNGCPIRATHFVTHRSNDYSLSHLYYSMGHEFGAHPHQWNTALDPNGWIDEAVALKNTLEQLAGIPADQVIGIRTVGLLQISGDEKFNNLSANGFLYDCSTACLEFGHTNMANGLWPYSADFPSDLACQIRPRPTCSHPGLWVQPIMMLEDMWLGVGGEPGVGMPCPELDSCTFPDGNAETVYAMLMRNFIRAHSGNTRAPFSLPFHASWFYVTEGINDNWHFEGFKMFLREITTNPTYNDTWVVPVREGVAYRRNPVPLSVLWDDGFEPFQCGDWPAYDCTPRVCSYYNVTSDGLTLGQINMKICDNFGPCPKNYSWFGSSQ